MHPRARAPQQEKPLLWEACAPQLESSPHLLQLEKALAQWVRPRAAKDLKTKKTLVKTFYFYTTGDTTEVKKAATG